MTLLAGVPSTFLTAALLALDRLQEPNAHH